MVWHSPARPIAGRAQLTRIYRTGEAYDLGYVYVEGSGITIGVRLDPDGGAKVPHGVNLSPEDHAAVEAAAHTPFMSDLLERFALQREKRLNITVGRERRRAPGGST